MRPHGFALRPRTNSYKFEDNRRRPRVEKHGVYAFTGPPGSGKTLLAVHFARKYVKGQFDVCPCGEKSGCKWVCFSNLESTWKTKNNKDGWSEPLDVAGAMIDRDQNINHSILLLDEAYLYADSRRAQKGTNLEMGYFVAQRRKISGSIVKMFYSVQSINMIDRRVREMTSRVYNCWTDNEGRHVKYTLTHLAQGHLPPWLRNKTKSSAYKELTEHDKKYYDQHELVDADEINNKGQQTTIILKDEKTGEMVRVSSDDAIEYKVSELIQSNHQTITTAQIVDGVMDQFSLQISTRMAKDFMNQMGYASIVDESGETAFQVMANHTEGGINVSGG